MLIILKWGSPPSKLLLSSHLSSLPSVHWRHSTAPSHSSHNELLRLLRLLLWLPKTSQDSSRCDPNPRHRSNGPLWGVACHRHCTTLRHEFSLSEEEDLSQCHSIPGRPVHLYDTTDWFWNNRVYLEVLQCSQEREECLIHKGHKVSGTRGSRRGRRPRR